MKNSAAVPSASDKGMIIFLNGSSSAGKSTLADALQEQLNDAFLHISLDQFRDSLPGKYRGLNAPTGTTGAGGMNVVPITDIDRPYTAIQFGPEGLKMLSGMRRAIASLAAAGNNIIIDDILFEPAFLKDYLEVLQPFSVVFVGVRCPEKVIAKREVLRPGRFPGTAIGHFDICHVHKLYDVEVDTSLSSPQECAELVIKFLQSQSPGAFDQLSNLEIKS
ncbi:MAG: chloramphenicol phosphotransferase CPT family protein [Pseudomonadales bacterium]|nr:chloramphenicol phosphotransferase CPT family protein [Pseudomonadales bacterium]